MNAKDRIARLADDATVGLRDDPELRLDVRAELASHIEETLTAHEADGKSPEEAVELALRAFGPVADVAAGLVEANRRRMKLRALARLGARALLVPAAVVVALVVCRRFVPRPGALTTAVGLALTEDRREGAESLLLALAERAPEHKGFLFHGDRSRPTRWAQQRAIWEDRAGSPQWFGNFITHLLADYKDEAEGASLERLEPELRRGQQLDPDNARYPLLLAGLWADKAAELVEDRVVERADGTVQRWWKLSVEDRALLERAMAQLAKAAAKPVYRTYHADVARERLAALGPARRFEHQLARIAWLAGLPLPDCQHQRLLARVAPLYGELLIAEGRRGEGERFLDIWYPLVVKYNDDAFALVELLLARAVAKEGEQYGAAAYERLGAPQKALRTRRRAERLAKPFDGWLTRRWGEGTAEYERQLVRSGSLVDRSLFPALDPEILKQVDLASGRWVEHLLVEQASLSLYLVVLLALMMLSLLAALRWRWARGMAAPMLLLPDWRTLLRILAPGVLLPLAIFYAYTRWSGLSGREFGFSYLGLRFALELVLLGATIPLLTRGMATRAIRRRCESLGIPAPPRHWWPKVAWAAIILLWAACLCLGGRAMAVEGWAEPLALSIVLGIVLIGAMAAAAYYVVGKRAYGLYCGTVARSLIPILAAAILLIAATAHPVLRACEAGLLRAGSTLSAPGGPASFTQAEALMVERLKGQLAQAARDPEAGS